MLGVAFVPGLAVGGVGVGLAAVIIWPPHPANIVKKTAVTRMIKPGNRRFFSLFILGELFLKWRVTGKAVDAVYINRAKIQR